MKCDPQVVVNSDCADFDRPKRRVPACRKGVRRLTGSTARQYGQQLYW